MNQESNDNMQQQSYSPKSDTVLNGQAMLDLTAFGIPNQPYPCVIHGDIIGRPEVVEINIPHIAKSLNDLVKKPEALRDEMITIQLPDGCTLRAKVEILSSWRIDPSGESFIEIHISDSVIRCNGTLTTDTWRICLTNVKLRMGDKCTEYRTPRGSRKVRDKVAFSVAGREWLLIDEWTQRWNKEPKPDTSKPLPTARLETSYRHGDTLEEIEKLATNIEALLRMALCKGVTWWACQRIVNDKVVESHEPARWIKPFVSGGPPLIDNFQPFEMKSFLETAYPCLAADREWFISTLTQYILAIIGNHLEIRMSLQNTLLDRISVKVLQHDELAEIDPNLPANMTKGWRKRFHELMLEVSPRWNSDRTGQLISIIKDWNARPSFPGGVERAAVRLGLWPPSKKQLAKRHKLIHLGEYDTSDGTSVYE